MISTTFTLETVEYFLLILVRISSFVFIAPFYGQSNVPRMVKVGFSVFVSILVLYAVEPTMVSYSTTLGYAVLVLKEGITGLLIGFVANICNSIILFAGHMIDSNIGLSMSQEYNAAMATQTTVSGDLYYYFLMLLLVVSNMHQYILRAFIDSYTLIPLGGMAFNTDKLLVVMTKLVTDVFIIAFRIILPFFACIMILNCILGIMAKVAPQMHMFSIGHQLKTLVGFLVMFVTLFLLPDIANFIFDEMKTIINLVIKGMMVSG